MSAMNELFEHNFKTFSNNEKFISAKDQDFDSLKVVIWEQSVENKTEKFNNKLFKCVWP
jgi:hypothetical protein